MKSFQDIKTEKLKIFADWKLLKVKIQKKRLEYGKWKLKGLTEIIRQRTQYLTPLAWE